jgi:hypothetical protein
MPKKPQKPPPKAKASADRFDFDMSPEKGNRLTFRTFVSLTVAAVPSTSTFVRIQHKDLSDKPFLSLISWCW